ncbi:hypothetical protein LJB90_03460 [Eubacteriales bacterium OttesenSCG-928-G02]|nr:hypothetical protein [Eubacteriales bacterium OttesenSCG-928-G02]
MKNIIHRYIQTVFTYIAFAAFLLCVGTVGAVDHGCISFSTGFIKAAVYLAITGLFAWLSEKIPYIIRHYEKPKYKNYKKF